MPPCLLSTNCWAALGKLQVPPRVFSGLEFVQPWNALEDFNVFIQMWNHPALMVGNSSSQKSPETQLEGSPDKTWLGMTMLGPRREEEQDLEGSGDCKAGGGKLYTNWINWAFVQNRNYSSCLCPSRFYWIWPSSHQSKWHFWQQGHGSKLFFYTVGSSDSVLSALSLFLILFIFILSSHPPQKTRESKFHLL